MDNKLAAAVIHDIKNALAVLEGELVVLSEKDPAAKKAFSLCAGLREKLIGFLTLYKGKLTAHIESVCPADFLYDVSTALILPPNPPSIKVEIAENVPVIWFFDERLVQMALEAAVQNALRFAKTGIILGAKKEDGFLVFFIQDDGPGLGSYEATPSTGLGTELCRAIAKAHGEKAEVRLYNSPSDGAVFEMWLP